MTILIMALSLTVINFTANRYRYKQLYRAYRFYLDMGVPEAFIDYTLMEADELEETRVHLNVVSTRRKELFWRRLSNTAYLINMIICFSSLLLLFYGILTAPIYIGITFAALMILNSYLTRSAWKKATIQMRK
ncbi:hypothetical protein KEJ25_09920 [Candidatus Bathyarchaeota archaeon]|nr:hypothetical protein [Candidatus Bathyarchaeota archaeon]